jgi:hypothetical protein
MKAINIFTVKPHEGEYESHPLVIELLLRGNATSKTIPGYSLELQYRYGSQYLFMTSRDGTFDESYHIVLTNENLDLVDRKNIGDMYMATWLEGHEVVAENQLLLHFDSDFKVRATINGGLILEEKLKDSSYCSYSSSLDYTAKPKTAKTTNWWKFW